jgi:hypothetical protein
VTTGIAWRDGEPRRGAYNLLNLDRVIAVATETGLKVQVEVQTEPKPTWTSDENDAGRFFEYVRRRVEAYPAVIRVSRPVPGSPGESSRATVGRAEGALTPSQARRALWSAFARGSRSFRFVDPERPVGPEILALGETVGVITRNPALFAPLQRRNLRKGDVTIAGDGKISIDILESNEAIVIVGINGAAEVRKATITFPPDIPEAIWQNMEEGMAVHFVMGPKGPVLEHTFAPEDVVVLAIRKEPR